MFDSRSGSDFFKQTPQPTIQQGNRQFRIKKSENWLKSSNKSIQNSTPDRVPQINQHLLKRKLNGLDLVKKQKKSY